MLDPENERVTFLRNVCNYVPANTAKYPTILKSLKVRKTGNWVSMCRMP